MSAIEISGPMGLGDMVRQRGILRELMKDRTVYLRTRNVAPFYDLIAAGLKISQYLPDPIITEHTAPPPLEAAPPGTPSRESRLRADRHQAYRLGHRRTMGVGGPACTTMPGL